MMLNTELLYDVAVIGGGLAGLSTAISCAQKGVKVILFEKENYPFHKVCGEYISMHSWNYLHELGINLNAFKVPFITKLLVSSPSGKIFRSPLQPGGFGISRYTLDAALKNEALKNGVAVIENCRVDQAIYNKGSFEVSTPAGKIKAKVCTGSFGKRSNLDIKWKRPFVTDRSTRLNNYIGVKYHVRADLPEDIISLHNFEDGYCGISRIDNGLYCLCYLTTAANLKKSDNCVSRMEADILCKNPHLKDIFSNVSVDYAVPLTISQISFRKKSVVHDHVLLNGDAAGMISPLCGNGMTMALHSGKILSSLIVDYLDNATDRQQLEQRYQNEWNKHFSSRMLTGRMIQSMFGRKTTTDLLISFVNNVPAFGNFLIQKTQGSSF